jgi:hypothetical protein
MAAWCRELRGLPATVCAGKPPPTASSAATTSTVQSKGKGKAATGKAVLKKAAAAIKATSVLTSGKGKKTKGGGENGYRTFHVALKVCKRASGPHDHLMNLVQVQGPNSGKRMSSMAS